MRTEVRRLPQMLASAIVLKQTSRWILMGTIFFAPWAYGCTRDWSKHMLCYVLCAMTSLFLISLLLERRRPRIPPFALLFSLGTIALGFCMAMNEYAVFDAMKFAFEPSMPILDGWPGTVDRSRSMQRVSMIAGLIGAFWIACDLMANALWRKRLWTAYALAGLSIIILGLLQRVTGARAIFWEMGANMGETFFATYRYHGNAGAFINLVLPLLAGRALLTIRDKSNQAVKSFWCVAAFIASAAAFVNSSRAAMVVTVFLIVILGLWQLLDYRRGHGQKRWEPFLAAALIVAFTFLLASAFGLELTKNYWATHVNNLLENKRYLVYETITSQVLPISGWRGFGPGTFEITFPFFTNHLATTVSGIWRYAHQDYLQTVMEWGWIGSLLWGGLIFGGLGIGVTRLIRNYPRLSQEERVLLGSCSLTVTGILLHALVDFPFQIASLQLFALIACAVLWSIKPPVGRPRKSIPAGNQGSDVVRIVSSH
ncbi:MAG TPA: O-antigen ligase family protein [Terrimicrobiaceae bacterium]